MSDNKWIDGPWIAEIDGRIYDSGGYVLLDNHQCVVYDAETLDANLSLVAAAPELYAMVEELTHFIEDVSEDSVTDLEQHYSLIERANDLLAKARGESQK